MWLNYPQEDEPFGYQDDRPACTGRGAPKAKRSLRVPASCCPYLALHRRRRCRGLGLRRLDVLPVHRPAGPGVTTPAMALPTHLGRRRLLLGRPAVTGNRPVRSVAVIARSCLGLRGITCMSCRDACLAGAIRSSLARGGAVPRVETDTCTGCADCVPVCPASAIAVAPSSIGISPGA
jgi:ferredoxin-type protein NapF